MIISVFEKINVNIICKTKENCFLRHKKNISLYKLIFGNRL
jgi:hypothetical protein